LEGFVGRDEKRVTSNNNLEKEKKEKEKESVWSRFGM